MAKLIPTVATFAILASSLALAQPLPQPLGPNRDSYDLHFENVPVATLAKVILGDILGIGYTIDPRVQGTVSLTSGRPVPKSDILFVLENALGLSNVALVPDALGYRLMPLGEAIGTGQLDVRR
jgi:general secretion pathway protein D